MLCCSAWSSSQEGGGGCPQLHGAQGDVEASAVGEAAWPNQRLPGGVLPTGERRASRAAGHHGRLPPRRPGTDSLCKLEHCRWWKLRPTESYFFMYSKCVPLLVRPPAYWPIPILIAEFSFHNVPSHKYTQHTVILGISITSQKSHQAICEWYYMCSSLCFFNHVFTQYMSEYQW